jgi:hypothetical protein
MEQPHNTHTDKLLTCPAGLCRTASCAALARRPALSAVSAVGLGSALLAVQLCK